MPDQKISELSAITTIDNSADVLPIVDTSATTTKKVTPTQLKASLALDNVDNTSDADKPISTATQTALDGKVDENAAITGATKTKITYDSKGLITGGADATTADIADSTNKRYVTDAQLTVIGNTSGTNTGDNAINSLYSGLATSKQDTLVSGTNIKTVNSTSLLGSGDIAVQATLVSGTNIKTINSTSLLGSGDITISASPSGVSGAIQFSNGSAFASDAANLFWDNVNKRWGVGTNAPTNTFEIASTSASPFKVATTASYFRAIFQNSGASGIFDFNSSSFQFPTNNVEFGTSSSLGARVGIKGSGSTSATTSLLVQNSSALEALKITDDGTSVFKSATGTLGQFNANGDLYFGVNNNAQMQILHSTSTIVARSPKFWLRNDGGPTGQYYANFTGGQFAIGKSTTQAVASALIEMSSTTMGFLPPRMTTTEKNAIASPAAGLVVYDTTLAKLCVYTTTWETITSL